MNKVDKNRPVSSIKHDDKRAAIHWLLLVGILTPSPILPILVSFPN